MRFKLIGGEPDRLHEQRVEFTKAFLFTDRHLDLLGRVYGKLLVAADDLDVPMGRIVRDERETLRNSYAYSLLCQGDRDCIEWVLDKSVAGGEVPARPRPAMTDPVRAAARLSEAIGALCDAIANAAPGWRWRLTDAVQMQLACEVDYLRLCGDGQCEVLPFLDDEFDPLRAVDRERGR